MDGRKIYTFLGLSVGCVIHGMSSDEDPQGCVPAADITYGTNNEIRL